MKQENYQETNLITKVQENNTYYSISHGGLCCGLKKSYEVIPQVGDYLTVHTKGGTFGIIRGMDLNGKKIFYKTDEELEAERLAYLAKREGDKQAAFVKNVGEMDCRYSALPQCFRDRIDKFRSNNPRFRVDYEEYELFCCEQAVAISSGCVTAEGVKEFKAKNWAEQLKQVPELSDGHSGNTFSAAVSLAYWYLQQPENVIKLHGALAPLVGSEEYGCVPKNGVGEDDGC
jgi:hypothetical protein